MTSSSASNPVRVIDTLDPTVLEERAQLIVKAAANLTPERWQDERELAKTKWFDYRFLSPIEATLKFVEDYQRAYRVQWRQSFDTATADKKRAIASGGLWHDRKEFTEFWNARAHADWLGVDYFIYCMVSMETALRRAKQKRILRPGQMRSNDCVQAVQKRQEEEMSGRVCCPNSRTTARRISARYQTRSHISGTLLRRSGGGRMQSSLSAAQSTRFACCLSISPWRSSARSTSPWRVSGRVS